MPTITMRKAFDPAEMMKLDMQSITDTVFERKGIMPSPLPSLFESTDAVLSQPSILL